MFSKQLLSINKYFLFYVHFLSLYLAGKERKRTKRKKPALIKRNSKVFYQNTTVSSKIPSGLRPEPPTAYIVSRVY